MDRSTEMEYTLRLPADLYTKLVQLAEVEHRSFQSLLVTLLHEAVAKHQSQGRQDVMDQWDDRQQPPS